MKTFLGAFAFVIAGITFLGNRNTYIYSLRFDHKKNTQVLEDTIPKKDTSYRLRDDSINKYKRDTFNRKDSFVKRRDSL